MISVCMATYNGGKYIREQLDSILPQLGKNDEVVISDDNSTDDTVAIIESYNDPRIKLLRHTAPAKAHKNASGHYMVSSNFENALQHASGDYIFLSDQDDRWMPDKVRVTSEALKCHDLVIHNRSNGDASLNITQEKALPSDYYDCGKIKKLFVSRFTGCQIAFSRKLLDYALPFPPETVVHDNWISRLAIYMDLPMKFIDRPLITYRVHGNNVSDTATLSGGSNSLWFKVSYRLSLFFRIVRRAREIRRAEHKNR